MESDRRGRRGHRDHRGRRGRGRGRPYGTYDDIQVRKPEYKHVEDICPELTGVNIRLKVSGNPGSANEVLMGDQTGNLVVEVENLELRSRLREGASVYVRNGYVKMKNDAFIRLSVNEWGKFEVSEEPFDFVVKKGNNISEVEYTIE